MSRFNGIDSRPGSFRWAYYPGAPATVALSRCPSAWASATLTATVAAEPGSTELVAPTVTVHDVGDGTVTTTIELTSVHTTTLGRGSYSIELLVDDIPAIIGTVVGTHTGADPNPTFSVSLAPRGEAVVLELVPVGPAGPGVPAGGATGRVLAKKSSTDYDTEWIDPASQAELDAHLGDTSAAHTASAISFSPTGGIAATDVQAALAELDAEKATAAALTAHLDDTTDAHDATAISYAGSAGLSATTVEAALDELDTEKQRTVWFDVRDYGTVDLTGASDSSAAVIAAIAAVQAAGGGTLVFPTGRIRIDSQIVIPNDGASTYPTQKSMRFVGQGNWNTAKGAGGPYPSPIGVDGTILDLRYTGGGTGLAKIQTTGTNMIEFTGITFHDAGVSSNPFIKTTNTALLVNNCTFAGNPSKAGLTCDQDAIILGGSSTADGSNALTAPYQGYGTVIRDNNFHQIRRAVLFQTFANAVVFRDNFISISCGSNLTGGACIELNPPNTNVFGAMIEGNLIEMAYYAYGIYLNHAIANSIIANGFYDGAGFTTANIYLGPDAVSNLIICGYATTAVNHIEQALAGNNTIINANSTTGTYPASWYVAQDTTFAIGMKTNVRKLRGVGTPEIVLASESTTPPGIYVQDIPQKPTFAANPGSICFSKSNYGIMGKQVWIKEYATDSNGWTALGGAAPREILTRTTSYTLNEANDYVICNGSAVTITLPTAVGLTGRIFYVKNINANAVTIATTSSQTVDGTTPATLAQWAIRRFMSDGSNWLTV